MLTLLQRSLMYFPDRVTQMRPADGGWPDGQAHDICVQAEDGVMLHGWHILPNGRTADGPDACDAELALGRPVVLYFSGNAGNRAYRTEEFQTFTRLGCDVFVLDYRGYGENQGSPTEKHLVRDAMSAYRYAVQQREISPQRILVFGESIGGGVATRLASDACQAGSPPGGLIIRSSFSSMVDTGRYHYPWLPVSLLLFDRYLSENHIQHVTSPILQFHGERDGVVPLGIGLKLHEAAPERSAEGIPKRFVRLPACGHNDVVYNGEPAYSRVMAEFVAEVKGRIGED
jgi:fermentation-respiration switch protein FrsA (DUF1100 family)